MKNVRYRLRLEFFKKKMKKNYKTAIKINIQWNS